MVYPGFILLHYAPQVQLLAIRWQHLSPYTHKVCVLRLFLVAGTDYVLTLKEPIHILLGEQQHFQRSYGYLG